MNDFESSANGSGVCEDATDLRRSGLSHYIKVFWLFAQDHVSDTTSDQIGAISVAAEAIDDFESVRIHLFFAK
jgi:hypothetical protein